MHAVANHARFAGVLARQHDAAVMVLAREQCAGQRAADSFHATVEREFAEDQMIADALVMRQLARRGEYRQRQRQVERRAFLAHVGWRKIDRQLLRGERISGIADRRLDAIQRLSNRALGQPDHPRLVGSARRDIDFDLDRQSIHRD